MNSITPTPPTPTPPPKRTRYASQAPAVPPKKMGLGQRIRLVTFGLILAGMPLGVILPIASKPTGTFFQTARWETTPCVVTQSRPVENNNDTRFSFAGSVFAVVGIGVFTVGIFIKKKKVLSAPSAHALATRKPVALRATKTPLRSSIFLFFVTVGWTAMVGFLISIFLKDYWSDGKIDWFLSIFVVVFSLVDIFFWISLIYTGMSALGPKLSVTMKPALRLGETAPLWWKISGNPGDIHLLKLSLVCVEKIQENSAKRQEWKEHLRDTLELQELRGPLSANAGGLNVSVPVDAMPCWVGDTEIVWKVKAELRHRFWPTQRWEFSIEVVS